MLDKSIIYFEDIDWNSVDEIKMIRRKMDWSAVEKKNLSNDGLSLQGI